MMDGIASPGSPMAVSAPATLAAVMRQLDMLLGLDADQLDTVAEVARQMIELAS